MRIPAHQVLCGSKGTADYKAVIGLLVDLIQLRAAEDISKAFLCVCVGVPTDAYLRVGRACPGHEQHHPRGWAQTTEQNGNKNKTMSRGTISASCFHKVSMPTFPNCPLDPHHKPVFSEVVFEVFCRIVNNRKSGSKGGVVANDLTIEFMNLWN